MNPDPGLRGGDVGDVDANQLRAPECAGKSD
jgi:hypothetical protein